MANFNYTALNAAGKTRKGQIDAASRGQAIERLRREGLTPLELSQAGENPKADKTRMARQPFWKKEIFPSRVSRADVAAMTRQLATLLEAGLPLDQALKAIYSGDDGKNPLSRLVADLHETILEGHDLAQGLARHPSVFSRTFIAMVHAGESSGTLTLVMERLASHLEQQVQMRRKLRSALAYPLMMLIVGFGIVIFLLSFVIPQVTRIFADMGRELPLPTRILLAVSDGFRNWWWLLALLCIATAILFWKLLRTERGKRFFQRQLFTFPLVGKIYGQKQLASLARTLGMLLKNGVPLLKSLQISRAASANILVTTSVEEMIEGVQAGRELSACLRDPLLYPPLVSQMASAGEKSGRLSEMLLWIARDSENNVEARISALTSLLEPAMILLLGVLVGFVVIAIILPIFEMSSLAG